MSTPPSPALPAHRSPAPVARGARLSGLLFFPVTPSRGDGSLAADVLVEHVRRGVDAGAGAVFVCCGTGEYFALDLDDYAEAVRATVEVVAGRVPVFAGIGHGTALARRHAGEAAAAGADGLLVMPPYLVHAGQAGLLRHLDELSGASDLDLLVYQRDNAIFTPETVAAIAGLPHVIGLKDGHGDLDHLQRLITAVRRRPRTGDESPGDAPFAFVNGLPTAETTALAYRAMGVEVYSSAVFCFAPHLAMAFWQALRDDDLSTVHLLLDEFYVPLVRLRDLGRGYSVSLVKAGVRATGLDVGPVRAPLAEPDAEHVAALRDLVEHATKLLPGARS